MALELQEITDRFIGAAIAVHRDKGPGFLEAIYENCLKIECSRRGIRAANSSGQRNREVWQ